MISVLASLNKNLSNIWESIEQNTQIHNFIQKSFSCWLLFPSPMLMGNFTKGKGELCQVFDSCGVSVPQTHVLGGRLLTDSSFPELRPSASNPPLLWTGTKGSGTSARWLLLSHLTECHWLWHGEGHLLQPLGERLQYHDCKEGERGVLTL